MIPASYRAHRTPGPKGVSPSAVERRAPQKDRKLVAVVHIGKGLAEGGVSGSPCGLPRCLSGPSAPRLIRDRTAIIVS
jgi:hypothetical protein